VFGDAHRVVGGALDDIISKWSKSGSAFATKMKNKLKKALGFDDVGVAKAGRIRSVKCPGKSPGKIMCFYLSGQLERGMNDMFGGHVAC
jgi:hypothetical protein